MTFEDIQKLPIGELNTLIDQYCFDHDWKEILVPGTPDYTLYELYNDPHHGGIVRTTVPHFHYTESWTETAPLALRYNIIYIPQNWPKPEESWKKDIHIIKEKNNVKTYELTMERICGKENAFD